MNARLIAKELKLHAPFTALGTATGLAIMLVVVYLQLPKEVSVNLFWTFHPIHVLLSALVTAGMYRLHARSTLWRTLLIGYFGSVGIGTLSDSLIPYVGEWLLDLPHRGLHLGFIEKWWLVNPLAVLGIGIAYFRPTTRFPHAGHVLLSTWASLFHITMALGTNLESLTIALVAGFLFVAVWAPCCTSDIVFPLLFSRERQHPEGKVIPYKPRPVEKGKTKMKIAVASGKGGTGKTTIATNMAYVASRDGRTVAYLDCDVEEPNGALFLKPVIEETQPVRVSVPSVDVSKCNACGLCGKICQYSAIVPIKDNVLVFDELCHGCGGCWMVCPTNAITESYRVTGRVEQGRAGEVHFVQGLLNIGEAMSPPVISAVKAAAPAVDLLVIDAPPGTSCPVIETVRGADLVLLVTEPTPFGLNDLQLAVDMVRALELPFAVVVNRAESNESETHNWCRQHGIPVFTAIPDDRRVAEAYSRGELVAEAMPEYEHLYAAILGETENALNQAQAAQRKWAT